MCDSEHQFCRMHIKDYLFVTIVRNLQCVSIHHGIYYAQSSHMHIVLLHNIILTVYMYYINHGQEVYMCRNTAACEEFISREPTE